MGLLSELFGRDRKIIAEMRKLDRQAQISEERMILVYNMWRSGKRPDDHFKLSDQELLDDINMRYAYIAERIKLKYSLTDAKLDRLFQRKILGIRYRPVDSN